MCNIYYNQLRQLDTCNEKINRVIYSLQESFTNKLYNYLTDHLFKLKSLLLKLKAIELSLQSHENNNIIIKNNNNIINNYDSFINLLDKHDSFDIEINNMKIRIYDYMYSKL
jgi:hypothetical protein